MMRRGCLTFFDLLIGKQSFSRLKEIRTFSRNYSNLCRCIDFNYNNLQINYARKIATEASDSDEDDKISEKDLNKTTKSKELIFLIGVDGKILGTKTKGEAEQLARKNKWSLIQDTTNVVGIRKLPTFKLLTTSQLQETLNKVEKKPKNQNAPPEKSLAFTTKIGHNDLLTKGKTIQKWVKKNINVRLLVTGDTNNEKQLEDMLKILEDLLKDEARFLQKRIKNGVLKVTIASQATAKKPATLTTEKSSNN